MEGGHLRLVEKEIQHLDMLNSKETNAQNLHIQCHLQTSPKNLGPTLSIFGLLLVPSY
jgi:hypothetical protein